MIKRFLDCYIPVTSCNLNCHYCYISQLDAFQRKLPQFNFTPEHIGKAMSVERLGGPCVINICGGGETLIPQETVGIVYELLKAGHYVMVVTNGLLTKRFEEISHFPAEYLSRLFFKFSFHFFELKRLNAFEKYFANIKLMDSVGCSFTVELTANDECIPYLDEIKQICVDNVGAPCHVSIGRKDNDPNIGHLSSLPFPEYCKLWEDAFDSGMFKFKKTIFYQKRREFCYAGLWSANINLGTGELTQCYGGRKLKNIFENIDQPVDFCPVGCNCNQPHCYNGHAFLTFGDIPELDIPTYTYIRDRQTNNGMVWVKPKMKEAFDAKLVDSNTTFTPAQKARYNMIGKPHLLVATAYNFVKKLKAKMKG